MSNPEYSLGTSGHAARNGKTTRQSTRLRRVYFFLAALWGFAAGAVGVALAARIAGVPLGLSGKGFGLLAGASAVALLGGYIAAEAYREARQRLR